MEAFRRRWWKAEINYTLKKLKIPQKYDSKLAANESTIDSSASPETQWGPNNAFLKENFEAPETKFLIDSASS